tara:strand:- start:350 stop:550 length:201 start_codon:yes stop_codon:yes gene_type:complete
MNITVTITDDLVATVTRDTDNKYFIMHHNPLTLSPFLTEHDCEVAANDLKDNPFVWNTPEPEADPE